MRFQIPFLLDALSMRYKVLKFYYYITIENTENEVTMTMIGRLGTYQGILILKHSAQWNLYSECVHLVCSAECTGIAVIIRVETIFLQAIEPYRYHFLILAGER